jgi:hypothetical protein
MKSLFFSTEELNKVLAELYNTNTVKVGFCEDMEIDVVEWYNDTLADVQDVTFFEELMVLLGKRYNTTIESYDVVELDELGVGYLFKLA